MIPSTKGWRAAWGLLLLAVTLLCAGYSLTLRVDPGIESMVPASGPDRAALDRFQGLFGADEAVVVAFGRTDAARPLFTRQTLSWIDRITAQAEAIESVRRVLSPTNARDLDGDELGPFARHYFRLVQEEALAPEAMGAALAAHPIFGGLLVSRDASTAALLIELDPEASRGDRRGLVVSRVRALAASAPPGLAAHVAGLPVEKVDVAAFVLREQRVFAPAILAVLATGAFLIYRSVQAVIVLLAVVACSLVWTMGLYAMTGRPLNPITSLVTPVVLVTSVEGVVHAMNHYLSELSKGLSRQAAVREAMARVGVPCFNAALTTAIGLACLATMPMPAIRAFGLCSALGVMISWLLTMTLAPAILLALPVPSGAREASPEPGLARTALRTMALAAARRPAAIAAASLLVLAAAVAGIARVRVETDLVGSLRPGAPLRQATRFIDERLTGVNSLEILIRGVAPTDPEGLRRVESLERFVSRQDGVLKVLGLPDLLARANRAFHAGDDAHARLPEGSMAADDLADFADLIRRQAPEQWARFSAMEDGTPVLRLTARVSALGSAASQSLFARIRAAARQEGLGPVELTGAFVMLSNISTSLVRNQLTGLLPALLLILAAMAVQFRSIGMGLLCAIPNAAPVVLVYGLMGWAGIPLSVPTAMIASIALGMTVDNTIHLMARFRPALAASGDPLDALSSMILSSGRAVVVSTLLLAAGFWVGAFSEFLPSVHFAVLMGAGLLLGLPCMAVLLPLALVVFRPAGLARRAARGAALALAVALAAGAGSRSHAAGAPVLKDQHGKEDSVQRHRGKLVVLLYARPAGLRQMKAWELRLLQHSRGEVDVVRAVDAREAMAGRSEAEVRQRLRDGVPEEISILIDLDGALSKLYGLPQADVSVTLVDPQGRACGTFAGPSEPALLAPARDLLTKVRYKGGCP